MIFIFVKILIFASQTKLAASHNTQKKKRQNMPKARKSTRNSDAMDAEGHEEVRDVFVVFTASSRFFIFFLSLSVSFYALSSEEIFPPFCESVNSSNSINSIFNSTLARILTESLCLSLSLSLSLFVMLATITTMNSWKR